jgi:hypothetical protein
LTRPTLSVSGSPQQPPAGKPALLAEQEQLSVRGSSVRLAGALGGGVGIIDGGADAGYALVNGDLIADSGGELDRPADG